MLVVDDDFMVAKLHGRYVSAMDGFTVVGVAHNGADALRAAERLHPDLVLLDIYLPDMDGIDVLRALRTAEERDASRPSTDALFITAAKDAGVIRAALRAGALHYLIKPFNRSALQEQLRHVAALRTRLDELGEARQEDVDQIFGTRPPGSRELPKGLAAPTADLVERTLRNHPGPVGLGVRGGGIAVPGERAPLPGVVRRNGPRGGDLAVRRDGAAGAAVPVEGVRSHGAPPLAHPPEAPRHGARPGS